MMMSRCQDQGVMQRRFQLYDMPDKGPTRKTLKATPEAGQTSTLRKDEVVSVDALYVDVY